MKSFLFALALVIRACAARRIRLRFIIAATLFLLAPASKGDDFSVSGVDFSNFLFLEVTPNANFQLSTTGDIYLWVPQAGLHSTSLDFRAFGTIVANTSLNASDTIDLRTGSFADINQPPTIFQDVVLHIPGTVCTLDLDSGGSIVIDVVAVPEPSTLAILATAGSLFTLWRRQNRRGRPPTRA